LSTAWSNILGRDSSLIQPGSETSKYADDMKRFESEGTYLIKHRLLNSKPKRPASSPLESLLENNSEKKSKISNHTDGGTGDDAVVID
jgi:hypothetical protein